jgi:hypothetical protein
MCWEEPSSRADSIAQNMAQARQILAGVLSSRDLVRVGFDDVPDNWRANPGGVWPGVSHVSPWAVFNIHLICKAYLGLIFQALLVESGHASNFWLLL